MDAGDGHMTVLAPVGTTAIYVQPRPRPLYPSENLAGAAPTTVALRGSGGTTALDVIATEAVAVPWGVELRAEWQVSNGYSYATAIDVVSVGPHPVPAGVEVIASVYSAVETLEVETQSAAATSLDTTQARFSTEYPFAITSAIPSGGTVRLTLEAREGITGAATPSIRQIGEVRVNLPEAVRSDARSTGSYSIAPLTSSGSVVSDHTADPRKA